MQIARHRMKGFDPRFAYGHERAAFSMDRPVMVAPLAVIPGAGHLPILEQPERTNEELKQWLNT